MKIKNKLIKFLRWIFITFESRSNVVMFESFGGKQYSDNPRAISEALHDMAPDLRIVWAMNKGAVDYYSIIPSYVTIVNRRSLEYFKYFGEAIAYVTNEALNSNMHKGKNMFVIQTWHGDRVPKKVLYDAWDNNSRAEPVTDNFYTDLCIAASSIGENVYRRSFRYQGEILTIGMPRNDKLINDNIEENIAIKKRLNIPLNKKILLYAPTFRDHSNKNLEVNVNLKSVIEQLESRGEEWICLIRAHSNAKGIKYEYDDQYVNVTTYFDMADLLMVADMLITDYSSSAGDFILKHKPTILAIYDYEDYIKKCRALNFSLDEAGFILAHDNDELISIIKKYNDNDYTKNCDMIQEYFNIKETGKASEKISEIIYEHYLKIYRM